VTVSAFVYITRGFSLLLFVLTAICLPLEVDESSTYHNVLCGMGNSRKVVVATALRLFGEKFEHEPPSNMYFKQRPSILD
jgi:hypothetical protein